MGDVDTVEELFTSGIISMFADASAACMVWAVIFAENRGLALILLVFSTYAASLYPRGAKRMLKAQRKPCRCGAGFAHVPETAAQIRTIHTLRRENYMEKAYDEVLDDSFAAVGETNFTMPAIRL